MPRKKTAQQAGTDASTQPVKKFKRDASNLPPDEPVGRRSLRKRSQDENKVDCSVLAGGGKALSAHVGEEVGSSRPRRGALHVAEEKVPVRGSGYSMRAPPTRSVDSCPLEVSVQVTPCDFSSRSDKGIETENSRKRKVKVSPKAEEKKAKLLETHAHPSRNASRTTAAEATQSLAANASHFSIISYDMARLSSASIGQEGLPRELPPKAEDPLFTRPVIRMGGGVHQSGDNSFSVLTYNILADCHMRRGDYSYTDNVHLHMDYRSYRIIEEIKHFNTDVVCLQEVEDKYYHETLAKTLAMLGYDGAFLRRRGDNYPEGSSTFFKTCQFRLKGHHEFAYADLAKQDIDRLEHCEEVKNVLRQHVDKEAVLLVSVLTHKHTDKDVVIGNTHISWTKFIDLDIPSMQVCYALKVMDKLSENGTLAYSLCGDFNTRITDPGYQLITEGYLNDKSLTQLQKLNTIALPDGTRNSLVNLLWCAFQHPARSVTSAYSKVENKEPAVTSLNKVMNAGVDYLWSNKLYPSSVTALNSIDYYMPNITYPSDHVSLQATYTL